MYSIEIPSYGMIYIPISMKSGTDIQAILRFYVRNLSGSNVDIAARKEL
jgi:hypothetical protein